MKKTENEEKQSVETRKIEVPVTVTILVPVDVDMPIPTSGKELTLDAMTSPENAKFLSHVLEKLKASDEHSDALCLAHAVAQSHQNQYPQTALTICDYVTHERVEPKE